MRESGRDGKKRQGRAEVVEPSLAVSAAPRAPARPPAAALRPERRELQSESASSSWGQQCHSVQGSEGQTRVPPCPLQRWSVLTCPFMPPESSFRPDTKCRGRAWHRLLLQLPPMTALFSTTKPYITHAGPAPLARSWLIHHPRTYDASPLPQKEDHILQLSPQNSKTRFSTLSARYSIHLLHS